MSQKTTPSESRAITIGCIILIVMLLSCIGAAAWLGSKVGWGWTAIFLLCVAVVTLFVVHKALVAAGDGSDLGEIPGTVRHILQELSRPAHRADMPRRVQLCQQALSQVERTPHPELWAALQVYLGNSLVQNPLGKRAENIEQAIEAYQQALQVMTREAMPVEWAETTMNLAAAYCSRIRGERAANIEQAIHCYQQALQVMTREAMPVEWATTMMNLATAYWSRIRGERAENIEQAIHRYQQALQVMTREVFPERWALTQNNLANAYRDRIRGERAESIEQAIGAYQQALQVRTREAMPVEWAETTMNLANAYYSRILGGRAENIEQAIHRYQQALQVMTRDAMPVEWAQIINNLANAYADRIHGERAENIEQAIHRCQQALQVRTREAMPVEWAETTMNLATAYKDRIRGERAENIEQAIEAYQQALQVMTRNAMPVKWAETTMNLAAAYCSRIRGERAENIEQAIKAYQQALEVRTQEAMPVEWAEATMNLATAYWSRIRGERVENIEQAIHCYQQALQVMTRDAMPVEWAATMMNLAIAYTNRIRGERVENIEQAIHCYQQVLQVRVREAMPIEWAEVTTNLATTYANRIRGERAENIEQAIKAYQQALQVMTRDAMPVEWATTMMNLATAYANRILGERAENIEQAIKAYQQALQVKTWEAMPIEWAEVTTNLANAYSDRIRGDRAENIERAIHHYSQALETYTCQAMPDGHRRTQRNLAALCFAENRWPEAITAFQGALEAANLLYQTAATPEARRAELSEIRDLPPRLAYALSQIATLTGDDGSLRDAVLALEQNRARWLSEALALRGERPQDVPDEVWQRFVACGRQIRDLQAEARLPEDTPGKREYTTFSRELGAAYVALDEAVDAIRRHAPDFMPVPTFDQIQAASTPEQPLVYLAVSPAGTVALVVTPTAIHPIHCDLTEDALLEQIRGPANVSQLGGYLGAYARWLSTPRANRVERNAARAAWFAALEDTTRWLWDELMGPVVQTLANLDVAHATLIPSGWLAFLPLHAAWTEANGERHYALDRVTFSYAPSARALAHAQAAAAAPGTRLFAVDNPDGSLIFSRQEVDEIARHFSKQEKGPKPWIVRGPQATRNTSLRALPRCDVYHFACHGSNAWNAPLESALWMYGHPKPLPLTVRDLLEQSGTQARLAFLSACETGLVGTTLPDEVVGLASGFLQAGAAGVVSTLWAVNDLSTALLAGRFYHHWKGDGMAPSDALAAAQRWLRDEAEDGHWSHPYYWAGFTLAGV